ncbi:sugar 3,4-ketoisomerase [Pontibacter liquoris]|uniref:sugar 3,4-ketoisomerase n=1 Tax=Pontibacter liquoris TaxID=2905677 RepID=UPI001FA770D1|nr:FdtA/QdtA family cupin domain-containing protein [Pontibacter liquoris]
MPQAPYILTFDSIGSLSEGFLTTTQQAQQLPFAVKRVFWMHGTPAAVVRGRHANVETQEVLVALTGSINVKTETAESSAVFELKHPDQGLYIPAMCWTELTFSPGAIALCLASTDFSEADYIRDHALFKKLAVPAAALKTEQSRK